MEGKTMVNLIDAFPEVKDFMPLSLNHMRRLQELHDTLGLSKTSPLMWNRETVERFLDSWEKEDLQIERSKDEPGKTN
jgi:hypothetical protein